MHSRSTLNPSRTCIADAATASPAARCHGHTSAASATIAIIATGRPPSTHTKLRPAAPREAPRQLQNLCLIALSIILKWFQADPDTPTAFKPFPSRTNDLSPGNTPPTVHPRPASTQPCPSLTPSPACFRKIFSPTIPRHHYHALRPPQ